MRHLQRVFWLCAILFGLGILGDAQTPAKPAVQMQVQLTAPLKSKKAKVGDPVTAATMVSVTLSEGTVPPGSKVTGHVRAVEADSGDTHTSFIAISFEEVQIKKGQTIPLNCFVRAALMQKLLGVQAQMSQGGQNIPPVSGAAAMRDGQTGDVYRDLARADVAASDPNSQTAHAGQVLGMNGITLDLTEPDHFSRFKSTHKNIELDEGLEMMLVVKQ